MIAKGDPGLLNDESLVASFHLFMSGENRAKLQADRDGRVDNHMDAFGVTGRLVGGQAPRGRGNSAFT